jgi:hypothetical protein
VEPSRHVFMVPVRALVVLICIACGRKRNAIKVGDARSAATCTFLKTRDALHAPTRVSQ